MWLHCIVILKGWAIATATGDFHHISYEDLASRSSIFREEGVTTYSQLLFDIARQQVVVGARDNLYRLTLNSLTPLEHAIWTASSDKASICQDKGQTSQDCHNFIKVLLSNGKSLFTCGTNAFSPICTWREIENIKMVTSTVSGVAMCPYSPHANVTALLARGNAGLFAGAPTDFSGADAAIYRTLASPNLRTHQYDSRWLNDPQFVGSFETKDHVYFLLREIAVEYINCGKKIYSRIARVCKNDSGGQTLMRDTWTTFNKARLNCSLPGEFPFYYDEIQGAVYNSDESLIYATFTTPSNAIAGSAVCAFNMTAISSSFDGPFKHQEHSGAAWEKKRVPNHYQQHCGVPVNVAPHQIMDNQRYQLMDDAIQGITVSPLHTTTLERFTYIAIDVVPTKVHRSVTILYVATAEGLIKKISVLPRTHGTCIVEVWGPLPSPAMALQFLKDSQSLYVGMETGLLRISSSQCHRHKNRVTCLNAQEPYCGWNEHLMKCGPAPSENHLANHWKQEVTRCPVLTDPVDGGWSTWGAWTACHHTVFFDASLYPRSHPDSYLDVSDPAADICQCQIRECNNPPMQNGGSTCSGPKIKVSNCTIHGGWTAWSAWSACSQTCGFAIKTRRRTCSNPAPAFNGRVCVGHDHDEIVCLEVPPCPVLAKIQHAQWSSWGPWDTCSKPCNGGIRMRERTCDKPISRERLLDCSGCNYQKEDCNTHLCVETKRYSTWTPWLPTNATILPNGGYMETRFRFSCKAHTEDPSSVKSQLAKEEVRFCNSGTCSRMNRNTLNGDDDSQSEWSTWYPCTKNCGGGTQHRVKQCETVPCEGLPSTQSRMCNVHACSKSSEDKEWSCWTEWSPCSVSCGVGVRSRSRKCLEGSCDGLSFTRDICEMPSCESLKGWDTWGHWNACDSRGQQSRKRICIDASPGMCRGSHTEARDCYEDWDGETQSNVLPKSVIAASVPIGAVVGGCIVGFLGGVGFAVGIGFFYMKKRKVRIPGSPHYISRQNPYVAVPLNQVNAKKTSTFCATRCVSGTLRTKPNLNLNALDSPKLYTKALDYESATLKHSSHHQEQIRADLDQEKYY